MSTFSGEARIERAKQLEAAGHHAQAEVEARAVLGAEPDSVAALGVLSHALLGQGRAEEAVSAAQEACRLDPHDVNAMLVLSNAATRAGRGELAVTSAERAVSQSPHDAATHYTLAYALLKGANRPTSALAEADVATRLAPGTPDVHNLRGLCLSSLGRAEEARAAYQQALAIEPQHALAMSNLAALEIKRNPLSAARRLTRAAGAAPQERLIHANLRVAARNFALQVQWLMILGGLVLAVVAESHGSRVAREAIAVVVGALALVAGAYFVAQLPRGYRRSPVGLVRSFGVSGWAQVVVFCFLTALVYLVGFGDQAQVDEGSGRLVTFAVVNAVAVLVRRSRRGGTRGVS